MKQIENNAISDLLVTFGTHEGMVGKNNEDFVVFAAFDSGIADHNGEAPSLFHLGIVADGVGGHSAGERASRLAASTIISYFAELKSLTLEQVNAHLSQAVMQANIALIDESTMEPTLRGMATTIAIVAIFDGLLFTAHIGDSRVYLYRKGALYQLTNDHSWVQEALEAGVITAEEARNHPHRNIIRRSLGTIEHVELDQVMMSSEDSHFWQGMPLSKNDMLLICSDGLTDMITDADIKLSLEAHAEQLPELIVELIDKANHAGGRDNTAVMVLKTSDTFRPNQTSPIPKPPQQVVHVAAGSQLLEEDQTFSLNEPVDRTIIPSPTILSVPTVPPKQVRPQNDDSHSSTHLLTTALPVSDDQEISPSFSQAPIPTPTTAENDHSQQRMISLIIGLALIIIVIALLFNSRF